MEVSALSHDNTGVMGSNTARVAIKTSLARRATESHLLKPIFLEKNQSPVSGC